MRALSKKGFTIIEVMIVLAIAGLIMLIVLIAIPQLQRNQRNTARKSIMGRIKVEVDSFMSNNRNVLPTADANAATGFNTGGGFPTRYLSGLNTKDPSTGSDMVLATWTADPSSSSPVGTVYFASDRSCNGEVSTGGAGARKYVIMTLLEGGASYCLDNK